MVESALKNFTFPLLSKKADRPALPTSELLIESINWPTVVADVIEKSLVVPPYTIRNDSVDAIEDATFTLDEEKLTIPAAVMV
ncbi:hypothetical protein D3C73_1563260 [compost metagenome]